MPKQPFTLTRPAVRTTSVLFASPHSGRDYPSSFLRRSALDERAIRSSEDAFVDLLFADAPIFGAPLLAATVPRAFVDLNRGADEFDHALIEDLRKTAHNPRVTSGLGVVPRVVANGRPIYDGKIALDEVLARVRENWFPYHGALQALLEETLADFGEAILIDCHSMPSEANGAPGIRRPEIVLGDRYGASAGQDIVELVESVFSSSGLRVARNAPFAGAYTVQRYGRPSSGRHVLQIEIDRSLYMDESLVRPNGDFDAFRELMRGVVAEIAGIGRRNLSIAAE